MKRVFLLLLSGLFLFGVGCSRDMNWVISNEPSLRGVVEEIREDWVTIRVTEGELTGQTVQTVRETRLNDCKFSAEKGDIVEVYFPGDALEGLRVEEVHGYCLIEPAEREAE